MAAEIVIKVEAFGGAVKKEVNLKRLGSRLNRLLLLFNDDTKRLDLPKKNTKRSTEDVKKGEKQVRKCSKSRWCRWSCCFRVCCPTELCESDENIARSCEDDTEANSTRNHGTEISVNLNIIQEQENSNWDRPRAFSAVRRPPIFTVGFEMPMKELKTLRPRAFCAVRRPPNFTVGFDMQMMLLKTLRPRAFCAVRRPPIFTVGFDMPMMELKTLLLKDEVHQFLLTAPAGSGKTTLVQMLCQDEKIKGKAEKLIGNRSKILWGNCGFKVCCPTELCKMVEDIVRSSQFYLQMQKTRLVKALCPDLEVPDEINCPVKVHPLALPPGAATPSPSAPTPQPMAELASLPINSQWQKGRRIGGGSFARVYVATNRETGALCAIKEVEIFADDSMSADSIKQLGQEIKILSKLKHPNIVQYYGSEIVDSWFRIYLEYVPAGSIEKYVKEHGAIPESVVRQFTLHILSGLEYLHSEKIVHRDIKGANLLIDSSRAVKLADFGMAKHLAQHAAKLSLKGTARWMAPEVVQGLEPSSPDVALAGDIWSVGCTIIEMLTGKFPWGDYLEPQAVLWKLLQGNTPPIPETLSSKVKDFLQCCFQIDPVDRPSAAQLLEHTFLKN